MTSQPMVKSRVFYSSAVSRLPTSDVCRPKKYKSWTTTQLHAAIEAVKKEGLPLRQAAEEYCIPKSTLQDHLSGKVLMGETSGKRFLDDEEEEELVSFLIGCAKVGYPRSRKEVIALVQAALEAKGKSDINVSSGWWESFKKRHSELTLRSPEQLSNVRSRCCSKEVFENYFDLLETTMQENDLTDKPVLIFNCGETGMPLDPKPPKAVFQKGVKHPRTVTTGNKTQIACCNAAGAVIPPFVIYDRKTLKHEMYDNEVPGTMYGLSDSGWMTSELFDLWFLHHFLPHAPSGKPLLLLSDGHCSHYNPSVIRKAAEEKVILLCLPPHSSHESQPLDKGPFGPLKNNWRQVCQNFLAKNPGKVVTRFSFSKLFNEAWTSSMSIKNIQSGFRCTGIYSLNRSVLVPTVEDNDPPPGNVTSLPEKSGLRFIPLYSPITKVCPSKCMASSRTIANKIPEFTPEELKKFEKRFAEGFDLETDGRYNLWKEHHQNSDQR